MTGACDTIKVRKCVKAEKTIRDNGAEEYSQKLFELQEEFVHSIDREREKALNHCYHIFVTLRVEGVPAIYEWHKKEQDMPCQSESILGVNKLFQIGLIGADDWATIFEKVNRYLNDRQTTALENRIMQLYYDFYHLLCLRFEGVTILTENELIEFLLTYVPVSEQNEQRKQFYEVKTNFREGFDKHNWISEEVERDNEIYWDYYLNR